MENEMYSGVCDASSDIKQQTDPKRGYNGARPKATIPLRVLDEEVWLSGSELKTDNDSSDEERSKLKKSAEDRAKKGARKKTRSVSTAVTKYTQSRKVETKVEKIDSSATKEDLVVSSGNLEAVASNVQWRPKRDRSFPSENKEINALVKIFEAENEDLNPSCNQADDEKTQLQKINLLEKRIKNAEMQYMETRKTTDKLVREMLKVLSDVQAFQEPEWKYFAKITQEWINCFSKRTTVKIQAQLGYPPYPYLENVGKEIKKRVVRKISSKHNIFAKNAKLISKTKSGRKSEQKNSLYILMKSIEDRAKSETFYKPYRFTSEETDRISEIDHKLEAFKNCISVEEVPQNSNSEENCKDEIESTDITSLTDSDKLKINYFNNSATENDSDYEIDEGFVNSEEEFNSCEEQEEEEPETSRRH